MIVVEINKKNQTPHACLLVTPGRMALMYTRGTKYFNFVFFIMNRQSHYDEAISTTNIYKEQQKKDGISVNKKVYHICGYTRTYLMQYYLLTS